MKSGKNANEWEGPRPASDTKHEGSLEYAIASLDNRHFRLRQLSDEGTSTGTTLWLSSQILVCYLIETERKLQQRRQRRTKGSEAQIAEGGEQPRKIRPLAVDLGAGIGLTSLVLASLGFDVITTDIEPPFSSVLVPNMAANGHPQIPPSSTTNGHELAKAVDTAEGGKGIPGHHQDGSIVAQKVDWTLESDVDALLREVEARGGVDLVVTADTLYSTSTVDSLLRCLARLKGQRSAIEKRLKGELTNINSEGLLGAHDEEESKTSLGRIKNREKREKREMTTSTRILVALERRDPSLIEASLERAINVEFGLCPEQIPQKLLNKAVDEHLGGGQCWTRADWEGVEIWQM